MMFKALGKGNVCIGKKKKKNNIRIHRHCGKLKQGLLTKIEFTGILKFSCCMVKTSTQGEKGSHVWLIKPFHDDQELTCRSMRSNAALELCRNRLVES